MTVTRQRILPIALIALAWAYVLTRIIPTQIGDRGIFVSVAERIAAGDRLYVDVWDNKDPLFYLTLGLGRVVSPYLDVVIELGWLVAGAIAVFAIARSLAVSRAASALVAFAGVPVILTGTEYLAGFTHLPGSALTLAVIAGALRGRMLLVGVLLVVLALFKLVMLPLAIIAIVIILIRQQGSRSVLRLLVGVVGALALAALLLALRGELGAYLESLGLNSAYAQSMRAQSSAPPVVGLLGKVLTTGAMATALGTIVALSATRLVPMRTRNQDTVWWVTVAVLATSVAVTAATGLWPHHSQILYAPAALALVLIASWLPGLPAMAWSAVIVLATGSLVLAGAPSPQLVTDSVLSTPTRWRALDDLSPATIDLLATGPASSYARVGLNDELGHALGLRDWTLACPKFHQYEYDPQQTYEAVESCIPNVPWLIVGSSLAPRDGYPQWNAFVDRVDAIIAADFTCEQRDWGRLCRHVSR